MKEQFQETYQTLNSSNIDQIQNIYANNIAFIDPFHRVDGLIELKKYFQSLYQNVKEIDFSFGESVEQSDQIFLPWEMTLKHPKLNSGKSFVVSGGSLLKLDADKKIYYHRDFFDAGEMLYENIPLLGNIIRTIKKKM